jgi:signal transduction histidine kinase
MRRLEVPSSWVLPGLLVLTVIWVAGSSGQFWPTALASGEAVVLTRARRWPLAGVAGAFAGLFVASRWMSTDDPFLGLLVMACFLAGRHARLSRQPWAAAGVLLLLSANVFGSVRATDAEVVFPVLLTAGPWLLGLVVQLAMQREHEAARRAAHLEADQATQIRQATAEERLRIARDFHDVVAHEISAVSLQAQLLRRDAEAGRPVTPEQLRDIEQTANRAMHDARRLLGVLRASEPARLDPQPGLTDVDALVSSERALGHVIAMDSRGSTRPVAPALSHAAFRILQESLTNARRHGCGETRVTVDWLPNELQFVISNPMTGNPLGATGHGLPGMQERAELFGGSMTASSRDGQWVVHVSMPIPVLA